MVAQGRRGARRLPWWSDPDWTTIDVGGDVRWITVKTGIEGGVWTGWGGDHDEWWHDARGLPTCVYCSVSWSRNLEG